jgi:hypothetical protein
MWSGKLRDVLVVLAVALLFSAAWGALLGWSANEFGLSQGVRLVLMIVFLGMIGRFAGLYVARRAKARAEGRG